MAKFKKKKSEPTPEPEKSEEELSNKVEDNTPDIEKPEIESPTPKPQMSVIQKSEKDRKLNRLFWLRVALAVIAGTSATFIFDDIEGEDRRWASIGYMILVFFTTIMIAKEMKMQLPSSDRKKIVTQAIGSYVFLYLFTWIVSYTLVNLGSVTSGVNI